MAQLRNKRRASQYSPSYGPELFVGLVSPTGTELKPAMEILEESLKDFRYACETIHLIEILHKIRRWEKLPESPADVRLTRHMDAGNQFRKLMDRGDALGILAVSRIRDHRKRSNSSRNPNEPVPRTAYILRALKHPEEVRTLREIYGDAFILVGIHSPQPLRLAYLSRRIAETRRDFQAEHYRDKAMTLIQRDQAEEDNRFGQKVRDTFHLADVFVDTKEPNYLRWSIERFVDLLFGKSVHTPTRDEYGMFHAQAAALRSADLSRQVGAAITTKDGDVIAVGTNDVPKAGGGLYWEGDEPDRRDFVVGYDSNELHKRNLLADVLERVGSAGWLSRKMKKAGVDSLVRRGLDTTRTPAMKGAQVTNVIEFGRAVHAEMAALTDAARRGVSVVNATMYTTTFPCHLCARHIVAAGIKRVVYIEPYAKSLAAQLYPDSISVDEIGDVGRHVSFEPFVGLSPRQYMNLFPMTRRKKADGTLETTSKFKSKPRLAGWPVSYTRNERLKLDAVNTTMKLKNLR